MLASVGLEMAWVLEEEARITVRGALLRTTPLRSRLVVEVRSIFVSCSRTYERKREE
jgi:hypothetical protein